MRPRLQAVQRRASLLSAKREQVVTTLKDHRREVEKLDHTVAVLGKTTELYRVLLDQLVLDQVKVIEGLVSEGLSTIFADQKLAFEAEVNERRGRLSIDFYFRQGDAEGVIIRDEPLAAFGGGPSSLASLVLRVLTLLKMKRYPVLLLDETLAAVSDEYLDALGQFLQHLARTTGIQILLVTHKQALLDHTDLAYQATVDNLDDGSWRLALRRLRGAK